MKKSILIACLGLVSLGLQAQSISLAGEWNVELGKSGSAFAKSKRASQGEVKHAILPGTIDTNHLGFAPKRNRRTRARRDPDFARHHKLTTSGNPRRGYKQMGREGEPR